jgi:hypothetical protein
MSTCEKHTFEVAEGLCRRCGHEFCGRCLVYSFGPKKPPFCVSCAILAAGVRSTAGIAPRTSGRELKRELRAQRKRSKADARHPGESEPAESTGRFDAEVDAWRSSESLWAPAS